MRTDACKLVQLPDGCDCCGLNAAGVAVAFVRQWRVCLLLLLRLLLQQGEDLKVAASPAVLVPAVLRCAPQHPTGAGTAAHRHARPSLLAAVKLFWVQQEVKWKGFHPF